jgi:hypothetical protein
MITKALTGAVIFIGAAVGLVVPVMADDPLDPVLTCTRTTCSPNKDGSAAPSRERMDQLIQQALSELQANKSS